MTCTLLVSLSRAELSASRVVGTGALHQSLRGSCHRPSGTDPSSAIMAAPDVTSTATRASTTSSVYGRVAQTGLRTQQGFANRPRLITNAWKSIATLATLH